CKMHVTLHVILVRMEAELAEFGPDHALGDTLDRAFVAQTITDEFRDRADLQSVMAREGLELWPPRHRAVVVHHFDDHGSRSEAGETGEVAARLRVPGARQHAARLRHDREDVSRLAQVF